MTAVAAAPAAAAGMVKTILEVIGIPEDQAHSTDTLSDLGMDSMQMVEVRGIIEKATGEPPQLENLTRMTIAELKKMEKSAVMVSNAQVVPALLKAASRRVGSIVGPAPGLAALRAPSLARAPVATPVTFSAPAATAPAPAGNAAGMLKAILEVIGIPEDQAHGTDTLSDLGMDSMQMVEVRGIIEKATGEPPLLENLTRMTIAELKKMEKTAAPAAVAPAPPTAPPALMRIASTRLGATAGSFMVTSAPVAAQAAVVAPQAAPPAAVSSAAAAGMTKAILEVIGIPEDQAHGTDTLSDLGMDSMQMVEVRGIIERATGEPPLLENLTRMTIAELKKMEKTAGVVAAAVAPSVAAAPPAQRIGSRLGARPVMPEPPPPPPAAAAPAGNAAGMLKAILEVIGIPEDQAHGTDTLSDLGMDSMQMVEVRGIIEKATGEPPLLENLTRMTIAELKKMEKAGSAPAPAAGGGLAGLVSAYQPANAVKSDDPFERRRGGH